MSKERARLAIDEGVETPVTRQRLRLLAVGLQHGLDVAQEDLDAFIAVFENEEPGRHPPVAVRRHLLIEAGYKCAVCKDSAPLEFHHIIEWSSIKHHDAEHMLAVCANCHSKITRYGEPDVIAQKEVKERARTRTAATRARAELVEPEIIQAIERLNSSAPAARHPLETSAAPPAQAAPSTTLTEDRLVAMRRIFAAEITYSGPSEQELNWVGALLFALVPHIRDRTVRMRVLLLRTARAITQIQRLTHPGVAWTDWTDSDRLVEAVANVLAELDYDLDSVGKYADAALKGAREKRLLQFRDEDEWHPGMASGTGWVEKVSLSLIGEKLLQKADTTDPSPTRDDIF